MGAVAERDADMPPLLPPTTSSATTPSRTRSAPSVDDAIGVQLPRQLLAIFRSGSVLQGEGGV